jgi:hypothetical protein
VAAAAAVWWVAAAGAAEQVVLHAGRQLASCCQKSGQLVLANSLTRLLEPVGADQELNKLDIAACREVWYTL